MGSGRLAAVSDTGPLIHLAEIDCLPLLTIFDDRHVPEGVWLEADRPSSIRANLTFVTRHVLERDEIERFTLDQGLERLQAGERESLLLCSKLEVPVLLTDDLAVRRAAKARGLTPVGSLGIIARAHYAGRVTRDTAEKYLRELHAVSSLFVTEAIMELAIERLRHGG